MSTAPSAPLATWIKSALGVIRREKLGLTHMADRQGLSQSESSDLRRRSSDRQHDRDDSVAEGRNESVEPRVQRVSAFRMAAAKCFDCRFELDQGARR
jgi:hypothetical protein